MNVQDRASRDLRVVEAREQRGDGRQLSAQEWLRARDERLAASWEHVGAGIVEVDAEGRLLRVNHKICELTGYSAAELLGRTIFQVTVQEDADADRAQFKRQVEGELDRYAVEKRITCKNGGHFWAEIASSCVRDAAGKFLYAVRVQHDITARKQAEHELARRMAEQAALFELSERLQHITGVQEVYDAALDAITRALSCERASILLYDDKDVMRFVAWRGLSDHYRRAVEGHSPWTRDAQNPQPLIVTNVETDAAMTAYLPLFRAEGIVALAFIPLVAGGRLVGKFMVYYDRPRELS